MFRGRGAVASLAVARTAATLLTLVGALTALLWSVAAPARAHAVLQAVSPVDGAELVEAPGQVTLRFDEPVRTPRSGIRVLDAAGTRIDLGNARTTGVEGQLAVDLPDEVDRGTYVVTWRVTSADGHPLRGAWLFTVGGVTADTSLLADLFDTDADRAAAVTAVAVRWLLYAAALFAGGAAMTAGRLAPSIGGQRRAGLRRWVRRSAVAAAVLTLVGTGAQAALLTGLGWRALVDGAALADVLVSGYGLSAAVRLIGLAGVLVWGAAAFGPPPGREAPARTPGQLVDSRSRSAVGVTAGVLTVASFALEGHTLTTSPQWLVLGAAVVHLLTAAVWGAGLVILLAALRGTIDDRPVRAARLVADFSAVATWSVGAVAVAGGALGWVQVRELYALTSTTYGWTLVAKLVVLLPVAGLALYNHRRLVPTIRAAAGTVPAVAGGRPVPAGGSDDVAAPPGPSAPPAAGAEPGPIDDPRTTDPARLRVAAGRLRRSVALEVVGVLAVLGVTAVLVGLQPAAEAAGITGAYSTYVPLGDDHELNVTVDPNRVGPNEIHLYVLGADGRQTDVVDTVTVALNQPAQDVGPLRRETTRLGPGHFVLSGPELSVPGTWEITVEVPVSNFDVLTATVPVTVSGG